MKKLTVKKRRGRPPKPAVLTDAEAARAIGRAWRQLAAAVDAARGLGLVVEGRVHNAAHGPLGSGENMPKLTVMRVATLPTD